MLSLLNIVLSFSLCLGGSINVMSYNVENLFDTHHDEGKDDWTFLPNSIKEKKSQCKKIGYKRYRTECLETDWSDELLEIKLNNIARVIQSGPKIDLLALVEIENQNVVGALAKKIGFSTFVVSNSPDERGVDLALLYRGKELEFVKKEEVSVTGEYFKNRPTRNILEVHFLVNKVPLIVFVNHWPSQGNPTLARIRAAHALKTRIQSLRKENKENRFIALGDFNTIGEDHPDPFNDVLLKDIALEDIHTMFMGRASVSQKIKYELPPGTYFYGPKMQWNLLDRVFVSKNLLGKKIPKVDIDSYRIHAPEFARGEYQYKHDDSYLHGSVVKGVPERYNFKATSGKNAGFSDHFPIVFSISI